MTRVDDIAGEPWRHDFFAVLRKVERSFPDRPRIGDEATRRDESIALGQDPYLDFPASNLGLFSGDAETRFAARVKFLGLLGPQGPLPLATTEEAYQWLRASDDAFPRFLDLFNHRFLQLFYRAWADARPVAQHDRPKNDRFKDYVGSMIGIGSDPYRHRDSIPDSGKAGFAGLIGAKAKSASRLRNLVRGLFGVEIEIDEFVGSRLKLEAQDRTRLGMQLATLGTDALVGAMCFSVQDKIRLRLFVRDMSQYRRFLPGGDCCEPLADLLFFYMGDELDWDVELAIPAGAIEPVRLGARGELGWTGWVAPNWSAKDPDRRDARFHPADRVRAAKKVVASR